MSEETYIPFDRETIIIHAGKKNAWAMNSGDEGFTKLFKNQKCPDFIIILNVEYEDNDVLLPIVAVDDHRVLYGFGKDFGKIYISGIICLSPNSKKKNGEGLMKEFQDAFDKSRAITLKTPMTISHASGFAAHFYATGIKLYNANPQANHISFVINGLIAPVTNGNNNSN